MNRPFLHNQPRKVAIREFAGFHGRRSHSGAAVGRGESGANRSHHRPDELAGFGGPAKVLGESTVKKACRKRGWQHPRGRRTGTKHGPSRNAKVMPGGGGGRHLACGLGVFFAECVVKQGLGQIVTNGVPIQGLGRAVGRRRVSGDAGEMGQGRLS